MSGPVANVIMDDHPKQGDEYLAYIETSPTGDYKHHSFDPQNVMSIHAIVTQDGNYSVAAMYNANGDFSHTVHGGTKYLANSHTDAVTVHKYSGVGGGHSENHGAGHMSQTVATMSKATAGPHINSSNTTPMVLSPDGNGIHAVKGDQSHSIIEGGMYMAVDKGFSVNAKGSIGFSSSQDWNTTVSSSEGHTAGINISLNAGSEIRLTVGSSSIVMVSGSITITSPAVFFVKS